jgi:hypothetical protein
VSLTSYPARITSATQAIESIFAQRELPDRVVLVLSEAEFSGSAIPARLERLTRNGLEIMWVKESIRSYGKLLPVLKENPDDTIVTADDDILYPRWWLEELLMAHTKMPGVILGHRALRIKVCGSVVSPYRSWLRANRATPTSQILITSVGGALYPPGSLPQQTHNFELIKSLCPTADDIWIRAMSLLCGTPVAIVTDKQRDFPSTWRTGNPSGLSRNNVIDGANDRQLRAVFDHFDLWNRLSGISDV